jgi:hypothetical protein
MGQIRTIVLLKNGFFQNKNGGRMHAPKNIRTLHSVK